jgi:large subunit ribosomal protein L23
MAEPRDIIVAPIISEKSHRDLAQGKYSFKVSRNANKTEVGKAVHKLFNVDVVSVNMLNKRGKKKSMGRYSGITPKWKKAVVTLKKDQKIPGFFEGM